MSDTIRLTVFMTHPIQYYSPWFRYIADNVPELELSVLYASEPSPRQQGAQFGTEFLWDVPLRDGYRNEVLAPSRPGSDFGSERFWGLAAPRVGPAIEKTRPDVVLVSGWHSAALVGAILASCRRVLPLLYRGDSHLAGRERKFWWRLRTGWLLRRFSQYLSVGVRTRRYLESFGVPDDRIHDSPHAVHNELFAEGARRYRIPDERARARKELDLSPSDFVVLFVGKIEPKKRVDDLVRAVPFMEEGAVVVVVGSGPSEDRCRDLAVKLEANVRWCGFWNQTELGKAYGIADCLALPSDWGETWGLVVNEAMAAGLPCVVSDRVGCAPDLVLPGRTGEIFTYGAPEELARALERVRAGDDRTVTCQDHVSGYSFEAASRGLLAACRAAVRA